MSALEQHRRVTGLRDRVAHLVPAGQERPNGETLCGQREQQFLHSGQLADGRATCEVCAARVNEIGRE